MTINFLCVFELIFVDLDQTNSENFLMDLIFRGTCFSNEKQKKTHLKQTPIFKTRHSAKEKRFVPRCFKDRAVPI